jgi:hypothetical protein
MIKQVSLGAAALVLLLQPLYGAESRQATIIGGGGGNGRCTVEVNVDGSAEVEVSGSTGLLRTLSGQEAVWRGFQCTAPLPDNPVDFRFVTISGRGSARLIGDPRTNAGRAVIHINDPKGGRASYTFELQWREYGGGRPPVTLPPGHGPGPVPAPAPWPGQGGFPTARAIRGCQDSVTYRLNQSGYPYVTFERTIPENNPGPNDRVSGTVSGRRGYDTARFSFVCSVDFSSGRVRWVDVRRLQRW